MGNYIPLHFAAILAQYHESTAILVFLLRGHVIFYLWRPAASVKHRINLLWP